MQGLHLVRIKFPVSNNCNFIFTPTTRIILLNIEVNQRKVFFMICVTQAVHIYKMSNLFFTQLEQSFGYMN